MAKIAKKSGESLWRIKIAFNAVFLIISSNCPANFFECAACHSTMSICDRA